MLVLIQITEPVAVVARGLRAHREARRATVGMVAHPLFLAHRLRMLAVAAVALLIVPLHRAAQAAAVQGVVALHHLLHQLREPQILAAVVVAAG